MPSRLTVRGAHQPVREQVQAQVGVGGVRRGRREVGDHGADDAGDHARGSGPRRRHPPDAATGVGLERERGRRVPDVEERGLGAAPAKVARPRPDAGDVSERPWLGSVGQRCDFAEPSIGDPMALDPTGDIVALLGALVDIPSESLGEAGHRRRDRGGAAPACAHLDGRAGRQHRRRPHRARPPRAGAHLRPHRHRARRGQPAAPHRGRGRRGASGRAGLVRHEGRRRRRAGTAPSPWTDPTRDVTYVFYEAEEIEERVQRAASAWPRPARSCSPATSPC